MSLINTFFRSLGRFFLCLMWVLCAVGSVTADVGVSVTGTVTDTSGSPLSGAHLTVVERSTVAVADWNGHYQIRNLPTGNYTLIATHVGFHSDVRQVITSEGTITRIHFRLSPQPVELQPAVVHTTSPSQNFHPQIIVITRQQWRTSGAQTVGDALRNVSGISILEGDHRQRLSLRGSPPRTVRIDLDGVPIHDAGTGEAEVGQIDLNQLESITVEFEAVGGRVQLSTVQIETPDDRSRPFNMTTGYGSTSRMETAVQLQSVRSNSGGLITWRYTSDRGNFHYHLDDGTEHLRINNDFHAQNGFGKLRLDTGQWSVDGGIYYEQSQRGVPGLIKAPLTPEARLDAERLSGRLSCLGWIGSTHINAVGYLSDYTSHYTSPAKQFDPSTGLWVNHSSEDCRQNGLRYGINTDAVQHWKFGRLRFGYNFQHDRYLGEDLLRDRITVGGVGFGSAYRTVHRIELNGNCSNDLDGFRMTVNPATALEWIRDSGHSPYIAFSPALSTGIDRRFSVLNANLTVGYGKSLSAPPFNALFGVESLFAVGNKDLKPEQGESVNVGLTLTANPPFAQRDRSLYSPPAERGGNKGGASISRCELGINWFQRSFKDMIVWRRNFQGKYYPDNISRTRTTGIEVNASMEITDMTLSGNYCYNNSINDTPGDINRGKMIPLIPRHSGSTEITVRDCFSSSVAITLRSRWVGRRFSTESNLDPISTAEMELPAYSVYDIHLIRDWKVNKVEITTEFTIKNLLDHSYRIIERSPMPGRSFYVRLSFSY